MFPNLIYIRPSSFLFLLSKSIQFFLMLELLHFVQFKQEEVDSKVGLSDLRIRAKLHFNGLSHHVKFNLAVSFWKHITEILLLNHQQLFLLIFNAGISNWWNLTWVEYRTGACEISVYRQDFIYLTDLSETIFDRRVYFV